MNIYEIRKLNEEIRQILKEEKQLDFCNNLCYNINEAEEKLFIAEYTKEAKEQLKQLSLPDRKKIIKAIEIFEKVGKDYPYINHLRGDLYEIKPKGVRAYFKYFGKQIIIVGFITLKKTQKAPNRYIDQAETNIINYIKERN